jgi:hypothetical protein
MRIKKEELYERGYLFSEKMMEAKNINFIEHLVIEMGFEKKEQKSVQTLNPPFSLQRGEFTILFFLFV